MSFLFKMPSMPAPPPIVEPKVEDVPNLEDAARKDEAAAEARKRDRLRKGRRSTILTTPELEDTEADTNQPTLLGG
jgi:hypothetical protein|tara:strand:- start:504 stop:731 length:228 start_codon:yes stop_codon:yes gene_type:complete